MVAMVDELVTACLFRVFNERDDDARVTAISEIFAEDAVFSDPDLVVRGQRALNERAKFLLDQAPDFVFSAAGPVRVCQDLGTLEWQFGPPGQAAVVTGIDIITVEHGRIKTLHTLITS